MTGGEAIRRAATGPGTVGPLQVGRTRITGPAAQVLNPDFYVTAMETLPGMFTAMIKEMGELGGDEEVDRFVGR